MFSVKNHCMELRVVFNVYIADAPVDANKIYTIESPSTSTLSVQSKS